MIATASTTSVSYGTDPTAAAVTAGLRVATFAPSGRDDGVTRSPAPLDVDRLYPRLSRIEAPKASFAEVVRNAIVLVRRALAPTR